METLYLKPNLSLLSDFYAKLVDEKRKTKSVVDAMPIINRVVETVDFDEETRNAKIVFVEITEYKTIIRYVTRNYVKTPIYSDYKSKNKSIYKSIKLTNDVLENLNHNDDRFISSYAEEIICKLKNLSLLPSWFMLEFLDFINNKKTNEINKKISDLYHDSVSFVNESQESISKQEFEKEKDEYLLDSLKTRLFKVEKKIKRFKKASHNPLLFMITFGFYGFYISKKHGNRLNARASDLKSMIANYSKDKLSLEQKIIEMNENLSNGQTKFKEKISLLENDRVKIKKYYDHDCKTIRPLPEMIESIDNNFFPIKNLAGINYKRIIGCYVIQNIENKKCYVGQSKDVLKRLKQHFHGTKPKNYIFTEDYYNSKLQDKSLLFQVKIIPLSTKNELDDTERNLISKYDAMQNGYNGTNGNN